MIKSCCQQKTFIFSLQWSEEGEDRPGLSLMDSGIFRQKQVCILLLPVGHPPGLDRFVGCIDLTYLRDSLTNIRI